MQGTDLNSAVPTLQLAAEELAPLTQAARATSWRQALSDAYEVQRPVVYRAAASAFLTSWMPLLPSAPTGSVLNLDASLGAVSEGLAYHYPHVVHVSLDPAHLAFSRTRLLQEGALNVDCVESDPLELPVMDEGADLVVAVHLFQLARRYAEGARARQEHMERELATEVFRVLKPGGVALFGIQGRPGSRSPLPNSLHVFGTAKGHYRRLFDRTGFESASFYAALPDVSSPRTVVPLEDRVALKSVVQERMSACRSPRDKARVGLALLAAQLNVLPGILSQLLALARKGRTDG